jgi:hypothetical protein
MELGNFFEQLAVGNNGNYDGWETPVVQADKTVDE